jgi:HlyD family secretion protein
MPKDTFRAVVSEIGDNAIVRSTGVSTSQQTTASQEAKDFKVVVTLLNPPPEIRPGLSATAKITTASRSHTLSIPIQALTVRKPADLKPDAGEKGSVQAAAPQSEASNGGSGSDKDEIQGVFVVRDQKAEFVSVDTGIAGTTDIEVLKGLKEGDEIITGSYKVLRTLRPGVRIKIDNSAPKNEGDSS